MCTSVVSMLYWAVSLVHLAVDLAQGLIPALVSRGRVAGLRPVSQVKVCLAPPLLTQNRRVNNFHLLAAAPWGCVSQEF